MKKNGSLNLIGDKKGAILLTVLGFLIVLSVLLSLFVEEVKSEMLYKEQIGVNRDLELAANNALNASIAVLIKFHDKDKGLFSTKQGWGDPIKYVEKDFGLKKVDGIRIKIKVKDFSGMYPISQIGRYEFDKILSHLEVPLLDGQHIIDEFRRWQANGIKNKNLDNENKDDNPKKQVIDKLFDKFQSLDEAFFIPAFRSVFFESAKKIKPNFKKLKSMISLYGNHELVNINTASESMLECLSTIENFDLYCVKDYLKKEEKNSYYRNLQEMQNLGHAGPQYSTNAPDKKHKNVMGFQSRTLRIKVTARRGDASFHLTAFLVVDKCKGSNSEKQKAKKVDIKNKKS